MTVFPTAQSVGDTTFLRHHEQFSALIDAVPSLPSWRRGAPLRVWSAGCGTGEEAWTLAGLLSRLPGAHAQVVGTDRDVRAVQRAAAGRYGLWSLRGVADTAADDWLQVSGPSVRVVDRLRPLVRFTRGDLTDGAYPRDLDVVLCRNVLAWLPSPVAEAILARFTSAVAPGGVLILGPSDPTPPHHHGWVEESSGCTRLWRRADDDATLRGAPGRAHAPPRCGQVHLARRRPPTPSAPRPSASFAPDLREGLAIARGLAALGAPSDAVKALQPVLEAHPESVDAHQVLALVALEAGQYAVALSTAHRACALAPDGALPHFVLGWCLAANGDPAAPHAFQAASERLPPGGDRDGLLPFGDGLSVALVKRMLSWCLSMP